MLQRQDKQTIVARAENERKVYSRSRAWPEISDINHLLIKEICIFLPPACYLFN